MGDRKFSPSMAEVSILGRPKAGKAKVSGKALAAGKTVAYLALPYQQLAFCRS